jgi:hypothetical protein
MHKWVMGYWINGELHKWVFGSWENWMIVGMEWWKQEFFNN